MTRTCEEIRELAAGFVLGALDPDEDAAVREHLADCSEAHEEFAALGGVVPYLAESLEPVEPPAGLRSRLLAAVAAEPRRSGVAAAPDAATAPEHAAAADAAAEPRRTPAPVPLPSVATVVPIARRRIVTTWALRLAAVFAIAALGTWNLTLQSRLDTTQGDLAAAQAYSDSVARVLAAAARPGATTALLTAGDAGGPVGIAAVGPDGSIVLSMRALAATTGSQVYEAWVIGGDGSPIPVGGFQVGATGIAAFQADATAAGPGATLALTLEPAAGATVPTMPIVAAGTVTGAG